MNLSKSAKCNRVLNGATTGTGTSNGSAVDMTGFKACTFYIALGAVGSSSPLGSVTIKVQQSNQDTSPIVWSDLAGTLQTYANTDDNEIAIVEIDQPSKQYLRCVVIRAGGNSVLDGAIALQTGAYAEPVTHGSTVLGAEYHLSPAEGTA